MKSKLNYLIGVSLKRKIKTKWFLIANVLIATIICLIANIDMIINSFGGDFNSKTKIYVIDNGKGFSEQDLQSYNQPVNEFVYQSKHVGIDNFKFRMKLLYKDKSSFSFYNNPKGGAVCEITIWEVFDEYFDY